MAANYERPWIGRLRPYSRTKKCRPIFCFAVILLTVGLAHAAPQNVELISSSVNEIHFRFYNCSNLVSLTRSITRDSTVAYSRTIQIALPPEANYRLISAVPANPVPLGSSKRDSQVALFEGSLVRISGPAETRGNRLISVTVYPVVGSQVYDEVEITIALDGSSPDKFGSSVEDPIFDRVLSANVLNIDQMKRWRARPKSVRTAQATEDRIGQADEWIKLLVNHEGLCTFTGAQLAQAGLSLTNLASDSIRIFYGGGLPINVPNEQPRPEFQEIAILIEDGGDGVFGSADRIYFYGESVDRCIYPPATPARFINNIFTSENVYWLAVSGDFTSQAKRMFSADASPSGSPDTIVTQVWSRVHAEKDSVLLKDPTGHISDYYRWFWTNSPSVSFYLPTPGVVNSETHLAVLSGLTGGVMLARFNGQLASTVSCTRFGCTIEPPDLLDGLNAVQISMSLDGNADPGFDYLDLTYRRNLRPEQNQLSVALDDVTGVAEFVVTDQFAGTPEILDISNPFEPVRLSGFTRVGGQIRFETNLTTGNWSRYYCATLSEAEPITRLELVRPHDLRQPTAQVDLLVITPRQFVSAMSEYKSFREADGVSIEIVAVEDIMDDFGFGLYDPAAIRDFLKFAYGNYPTPAPSMALLVGDANHDFLDHQLTGQPNYVPAFIHPHSSWDGTYSDDNFVYFDKYGLLDSDTSLTRLGDRGVDMLVARWPVSDPSEIDVIVAKTKEYESASNLASWRSRITLVADDEFGGLFDNETFHVTQTEDLDTLIPSAFNREKIYLWDYPFVNTDKPAVNEAIVRAFSSGSLIVNYVGHGNPDVWSHEHVFQRSSDLPRLTNYDRLPLVFAASCAIGFFDDPRSEGMAEDLLAMSTGGAIGVVSATRLVYSSDNAAFNREVFDIFFNHPELSVCEAMYAAKLRRQYINDTTMYPVANDRAYAFFGDPCLKLGIAELAVVFDQYPDSLVALGRQHVSGYLVDQNDQSVPGNGLVYINLYDSDRAMTYRLTGSGGQVTREVDYSLPGVTLFRGTATLSDGRFGFDFVTPLDVGFGGSSAKLAVYAIMGATDAIGAVGPLVISDQVTASADSVGPHIDYTFNNRSNFVSGDVISAGDQLNVLLSDSSGINLAGGLGHGIALEIDGDPSGTVMLNEYFEYDPDDFTTGRLAYSLTDLEPGIHSFRLRVWDNANNSSSVEFTAEMVSVQNLTINDLLNYPNPMNEQTTFYFELTQAAQRFGLEIFTLSGKKIRSFNLTDLPADNYPSGSQGLSWDGRDADGDRVATGVYIYKATAQGQSGSEVAESFGKIVVIN